MIRRPLHLARTFTLLTVAILSLAFVFYAIFDAASRESSSDDRAEIRAELNATRDDLGTAQARLDDQFGASQALQDQVESLGEEPVVDAGSPPQASTLVPIPGTRGPAPTFGTVLRAVGQNINAALIEVCGGSCAAEDGTDGTDGADSTVPGPQGSASNVPGPRGPAGESIKGDPGANGTNGTDGKDGAPAPVIVSSTCNDDAQIVLMFDNETSIVVADSVCRLSLLP